MTEKKTNSKTPEEVAIIRAEVKANGHGLVLQNLNDMHRFAQFVVASRLAPSSFQTAEQIIIAIQSGAELGLPPMRALGSFCVVKGQARLWGDAPLALVRQSGNLEYIKESIEGEISKDLAKTSDNVKAICITKRKGDPDPITTEFTVGEARRAGLWCKAGTWTSHPQRMLKYKARSFNLRDNFPDAMGGATIAEEFEGIEMTDLAINDKPRSAVLLGEPRPEQPPPLAEIEIHAEDVLTDKVFTCPGNMESECPEKGKPLKIDDDHLEEDVNGGYLCPGCGYLLDEAKD